MGVTHLIIDVGALSRQIGDEELRATNMLKNHLRENVLMFDIIWTKRLNPKLSKDALERVDNVLKLCLAGFIHIRIKAVFGRKVDDRTLDGVEANGCIKLEG